MPEHTRDCCVILLDQTQLKVPIRSSLTVEALLDIASSHAGLKKDENRQFFGLYHCQDGWKNWLDLDKSVLGSHHDLPKAPHPLVLHYGVRYYVEDYRQLHNAISLEMYYQQSRKSIREGDIGCTADSICNLTACVMQAQFGNYTDEEKARKRLEELDAIPEQLADASRDTCEARIVSLYKNMKGLSRAESIIRFLDIVQSLSSYGCHIFKVKDKKEGVRFIAVGREGVKLFKPDSRLTPSEKFHWRSLQNVTYKDKKFWFEIGTLPKGSGTQTHNFYAACTREAMNIWQMAKDQHSFFKKRKNQPLYQSASIDEDLMEQLNQAGIASGRLSPSGSTASLSSVASSQSQQSRASFASSQTSRTTVSIEAQEAAKKAQSEMVNALVTKRAALTEELEHSIRQYKEWQAKEMQLTGVRPEGMTDDELRELSQNVQGIQYKFSKMLLEESTDVFSSLERELELKRAIVDATKRLVDETHNKKLKKDRRKELKDMVDQVKELERKLERCKDASGRYYRSNTAEFHVASLSVTGATYDFHAGTLPRPQKKRKSAMPTSVDDSCIAEMLFDSQPYANGHLSPYARSSTLGSGMMSSRLMNKSTGALNELSAGGRGMARQSPAPPHHSLMTSTPQPQRSKARSMHALNEQQQDGDGRHNAGSDNHSPNSPSSFYFHGNSSGDNSPTSSPYLSLSGRSALQFESSLRTVNLTDELFSHYSGVPSEGSTPALHSNHSGSSKYSPNLSSRYGVNGGAVSQNSVGRLSPTNRRVSSSANSHDDRSEHTEAMFARKYSYARATRDHPLTVPASPLTHPHIRPATQRVSDLDGPFFNDRRSHQTLSSSSSTSPYLGTVRTHSSASMGSGSGSPPVVGRSQSMLARPERHTRRSPFMDPHQEGLEMADPMVSLRSPAGGPSEGTYV